MIEFIVNYWNNFVGITKESFFNPLINLFNILLLLVTSGISYFSWKAASRANELQLLPLLSIYFKGKTMNDRKIRIRNMGKSPAYDVNIEHFILILQDIQKIWKLELKVAGTNVIVPDEERDLLLKGTSNEKEADIKEFMVFHLDPEEEHKRKRINLVLTFRNAEGKRYFSEIETGMGGLFVKPAKKINIWSKIYLMFKRIDEKLFVVRNKFFWKFRKPYISQPKNKN